MENFDALSLDGKQLKLFLAILDTGSVGRAATQSGLNQSTASHHLDRLRRALGDPLFVKLGKGITPSDFAIAIAPRIRALVAGIEGLRADLGYDPRTDDRSFTLAANTAECMPLLQVLARRLTREAPLVQLRFLELGSRERIEALLETGEVDLVLTIRAERYPASMNWVEYSSDRMVCFFDSDMRGPVETIEAYSQAGHAALDFGGGGKSTVARAIEDAGYRRKVKLVAPDINALAALLPGTPFVATFQSELAVSAFRHLSWCDVPLELPSVYHDLVWHRRLDASPRNQWFRSCVLASRPEPLVA
ncbi:MAG: LysR family transcriptional regulator [Pseudomonadota bacterium]